MSEPAPAISALIKPEDQNSNPPAADGGADNVPANCGTDSTRVIYPDPPGYFLDALQDGERLLKYAAEMGVEVDDKTRCGVLTARAAVSTGWDEATATNLLAALTTLAAHLRPVTAESLRNFDTRPTVRTYWIWVLCLAIVIVPFSLASFITAALSNTIRADITSANELAVKLTAQFGPFANAANGTAGTSGASSEQAVGPVHSAQGLGSLHRHPEKKRLQADIPVAYADAPATGPGGKRSRLGLPGLAIFWAGSNRRRLSVLWRNRHLHSPGALRLAGHMRLPAAVVPAGNAQPNVHSIALRLGALFDCRHCWRSGGTVQ